MSRAFASFVALGILVAGGSVGCQLFPDNIESDWEVEDARQFEQFPLYWLGESYQGLALTAITHDEAVLIETVGFVYGESSCNDSGCSAPIWVRIHPYCDSPPDEVDQFLRSLRSAGVKISKTELRGINGYLTDVPRIYLWTGSAAIEIDSNAEDLSVEQAARDLIPIAEESAATPGPLPPPASTEC